MIIRREMIRRETRPSVQASQTILQTRPCAETIEEGSSLLRADPIIDCKSTKHAYYVALASIATVLFIFGLPCVFMALMHKAKDTQRADNELNPLSFLSDMYRRRAWFVEPLMLFSRISISSLPILFESSVAQLGLGLFLSSAWAVYFASLNPFKSRAQNIANNSCNIATITVMIGAILVKIESETTAEVGMDSAVISGLLCVSTAMPFVAVVFLCIIEVGSLTTSAWLFKDEDKEADVKAAVAEEERQGVESKLELCEDDKRQLEDDKRQLEEDKLQLEDDKRQLEEQARNDAKAKQQFQEEIGRLREAPRESTREVLQA